jgi:maltoporin
MTHSLTRLATAVAALTVLPGAAFAADYSGYFRGGPGLTQSNTARACYHVNEGTGTGIVRGMNYRLGNECDIYGEFQVDTKATTKDGITYGGSVMVTHYTNATDQGGSGFNFEQAFAEVSGVDVLPEASFWIGKRRGRRGDVHIVDWFFTDMKGVGGGVSNITLGSGKLGLAYYKTDGDAQVKPGNRLNLEVLGLDSNPGGKTHLFFTATQGQFDGGTRGLGFSVRHDQKFSEGFSNTFWAQMAGGSASLESNFGNLQRKLSAKSLRLVESINWQQGAFGGQALAVLGTSENNNGLKTNATTVGGRISYGVTRNFKMLAELGLTRFKTDGQPSAHLNKLTVAPTLSIDNTFWSRPELRFYVTTARWNKAAGNVTGVAGFADKTAGTSAGLQVEFWY